MKWNEATRAIGGQVPPVLRVQRARLLLESCTEQMGVEEVECPACHGSGRLPGAGAATCPICGGFECVSRGLAEWFDERMAEALRPAPRVRRSEPEPPVGPRYGRCGEVTYSVSAWNAGWSPRSLVEDLEEWARCRPARRADVRTSSGCA